MATATKSKTNTASADLAKLTEARDRAHANLLKLREKVTAWDREGLDAATPTGTAQADLHRTHREDELGPNPHRAEYDTAHAEYDQLDRTLQAFKRQNAIDLIEEVRGDWADEQLREALVALLDWAEERRAEILQVREIVLDTPGLTGSDYGHDPRVDEYRAFASKQLERLDNEAFVETGLTPQAVWKVARGG